jgi:hypothetical protein
VGEFHIPSQFMPKKELPVKKGKGKAIPLQALRVSRG